MSNISAMNNMNSHSTQLSQHQGHPLSPFSSAGPRSMPNQRAERNYNTQVELFTSLPVSRFTPPNQTPVHPTLPSGPRALAVPPYTGPRHLQLNATNNDPVGLLIQYAHAVNLAPPDFQVISSVGPSHKPLFDMQVLLLVDFLCYLLVRFLPVCRSSWVLECTDRSQAPVRNH